MNLEEQREVLQGCLDKVNKQWNCELYVVEEKQNELLSKQIDVTINNRKPCNIRWKTLFCYLFGEVYSAIVAKRYINDFNNEYLYPVQGTEDVNEQLLTKKGEE